MGRPESILLPERTRARVAAPRARIVAARARCQRLASTLDSGASRGGAPRAAGPTMARVLGWMMALAVLAGAPAAGADEPALAPVVDARPPDAVVEQMRVHHRRGLELYDEGDYRLALVEFERAYDISPSFKILYNIGQVHFQLTSYARARRVLEQYLAEGGEAVAPARRAAVTKDLETLKLRTATLTVHVSVPGAEVVVDGESLGKAPVERVLVDAGRRHVQITRDGYVALVRDVSLAGGDAQVLTVELVPVGVIAPVEAPPPSGLAGVAVASWIVTGVVAAGAVGTGIAALGASSSYDSKRGEPISGSPESARSELEQKRDTVSALAATTDVLIGLAVVGAGISLYLTLRDPPKSNLSKPRVQGTLGGLVVGF